jgi:hypothetical protein
MNKSPYLNGPHRLADVIAAIQVMATYKFYKLDVETWADRIEAKPERAEYWRQVIQEHPEFFRTDSKGEKASLVWRRQHQKRFDVDTEHSITREDFLSRTDAQKLRVSRSPLNSEELKTLLETAIKLHSAAFEQKKHGVWWVTPSASFAGAILGVVLTAWFGSSQFQRNNGAVNPTPTPIAYQASPRSAAPVSPTPSSP